MCNNFSDSLDKVADMSNKIWCFVVVIILINYLGELFIIGEQFPSSTTYLT